MDSQEAFSCRNLPPTPLPFAQRQRPRCAGGEPSGRAGGSREEAASHGVREIPAPPVIVTPPPLPPAENAAEPAPDDADSWWSSEGRVESSAWLVSFVVHCVTLFLLGLITLGSHPAARTALSLLGSPADADPGPGDMDQPATVVGPDSPQAGSPRDATIESEPVDLPTENTKIVLPIDRPGKFSDDRPATPGPPEKPGGRAKPGGLAKSSQAPTGGGWEGRNPDARSRLAGSGGGTRQSELAVERGLQWLVAHQREDGSWCFDLTGPPCNGMCRNSGSEPSTTAATGLAMLPFLGAGYTHIQGEHRNIVKKGVYYLKSRAKVTPHGIDLCDGGSMYAHGIATIALCEAYGMTRDESLKDIAQGAIRYIVYAQDLRGGGWRCRPGMPGDTTVTGWQLMALKSGQMARLEVPSPTISRDREVLQQRAIRQRLPVRLHGAETTGGNPGDHHGRRTAVPDVHGLAS